MSVFVDTSALFAVLDADDEHHSNAAEAWADILSIGEPLVTTNYVLVESFAVVQRRLGSEAARTFAEDIVSVLFIHWVEEQEHERALAAFLAAMRRRLSLADCVSFEIMRSLGIRRAFAFDPHFREAGFEDLS